MLSLHDNETVVRRVRLKCHQLEPLVAQLRFDNVLQAVELHPAWLSPSAIVLVRRLRDPLPRSLNLHNPNTAQTSAWQRAVAAAMEKEIRLALRPALGAIGSEAGAVIFHDRAELLSCLASDWRHGLIEKRWWWRTFLKGGDVGSTVLTAWSDAPQYVPAALDLLAVKGQLTDFASRLVAAYARDLLQEVTRSFALPELQSALDQGLASALHDYSAAPGALSGPRAVSRPVAPWERFAPESLEHAGCLERQCLVGVALTIKRALEVARSASFAEATFKWLRSAATVDVTARSQQQLPATSSTTRLAGQNQFKQAPAGEITPLIDDASSSAVFAFDEVHVQTEFGGVFYLINLGLFLGLYGDFTTPSQPGLTLSIFDFLTLTAHRLLKLQAEDDPVWKLLAQLAGRAESDSPGAEFEPPREWRIPAQWLEAFPEACTLEWSNENGRLRVRHPSGFLLIDVPLAGKVLNQLKRELMVYDPDASCHLAEISLSLSRSSNSLEQWLDWIVPYVRARLDRALGIEGDPELGHRLCAQRASIRLSAVHLDIAFSLAEHPLEIRLAGLDRDPGWVPAAGRFIRFHYQ